ncbi:hypothetical protein SAMN07250955_106204 [Arboricoccus pini]|uniref:Uncharacterized protein n=1 Tax=Arboricoccus pini TaxID=1963835 RepID=A0A212R956_9PROT|nr:hypothetical protein SAMN07250955_106204 [Arboricoccus pini]
MISIPHPPPSPPETRTNWVRWLAQGYPISLAVVLNSLPRDPETGWPAGGLPAPPLRLLLGLPEEPEADKPASPKSPAQATPPGGKP